MMQLHKMKQIIIRERKTEYKNFESNPIWDDNIYKCIIECRIVQWDTELYTTK